MKTLVSVKRTRAPVRFGVSVLAVLAVYSSVAQATSPVLSEVVVTASRVSTPLVDVLADVSVIDREQLDKAGMQSLTEVLANIPGVQISTSGSYRSSTGVFLRGATSSQTILLVNGVRMGSATSGSYSLESLPLDRIERIEVLRGAAAALYGPDAVGGVIQVFTRQPQDGLRRSASLGAGSDGQRKLGASLQGQTGGWGYTLGASHEKAKGLNVKLFGASGFNADVDGFEYTSLDASVKYQINSKHAVSAQMLRSEGEYGFDSSPSPNPLSLNATTARAIALPKQEQVGFKWTAQWTADWLSSVSISRSKDVSVSQYWRQSDGAAAGQSRFDTARRQFTWQNDIRLGKDLLTLLADDLSDEVDSTTNYTVKERTVRGVAASYSLKRDVWDALATVRYDRNSQFGNFANWALSGGYKLNDQFRLVGSTGTTFQTPSFNQLYWPCPTPCLPKDYRGNPNLSPQKGRAQEIGLRYQYGSTRASATVYRNEVEGFITPATNVQSNLAVLRGAALSFDSTWDTTTLSASYDYSDPRLKPTDARITRVARNVLRTQVSKRYGAWNPFAEVRLSSNREDSGRVILPGYGLVNIGTAYKIDKQWSVQARLNNLTDKAYSLANGFSTPGRNIFLSLHWND